MPSPPRTWLGTDLKRRSISALPNAATAQRSPAMLKPLVAEVSVSVRASTSGPSDANGTWRWPG